MKNVKTLVFTLLCILAMLPALAQNAPLKTTPLKGLVISKEGYPYTGITVMVKGSTIGTVTDSKGEFTLNVKPRDVLVFSAGNYMQKEWEILYIETTDFIFRLDNDSSVFAIQKPPLPRYVVDDERIMLELDQTLPGFVIPPPTPSAYNRLDKAYFKSARTFGDVDSLLTNALHKAGWGDTHYYRVIDKNRKNLQGFVLISQIEQIQENGQPLPNNKRWELKLQTWKNGNFWDYFTSLFVNREGYFKLSLFVITNVNLAGSEETASFEQAKSWFSRGASALPDGIASMPYSDKFTCTAYVYEFRQVTNQFSLLENRCNTDQYLKNSGILQILSR
ncbi:carboxypeptidase-like regulatory domain-containing protein [Emticicia sp. 17c]|uniref:carboxypeptidase-like regulatory domain-containing protein n=1 Tax=Emticicia sp. 17c TaxID=3127704 RepID=UPI00301BB337